MSRKSSCPFFFLFLYMVKCVYTGFIHQRHDEMRLYMFFDWGCSCFTDWWCRCFIGWWCTYFIDWWHDEVFTWFIHLGKDEIKVCTHDIKPSGAWRNVCMHYSSILAMMNCKSLCLHKVHSLKKGKSAGADNIPAELVQAGGEDVITALTTICSKIGQTGEWPTPWT